ncbi:ATP-dependent acyl-CoA ligase [Chachezhania sediminis]|uniref:ATP-dependent acyl-CoA ligase n=1 Tax=Chachezhania sediminis TaxID=2599291 RepID=UPI0018EEF647|nr:ATP-dependent acyl-CoA ligase [Chachezhania sediminis]
MTLDKATTMAPTVSAGIRMPDPKDDIYSALAVEFPPEARTLPAILDRRAAEMGDRVLVRCGEAVWSYAQTRTIAAAWAARLAEAGIGPGDRVAIHCSNRPEFLEIFLGCAWLGAIAAPFNTAFKGPQLAHVLDNADPKLLVAEECFLDAYAVLSRDEVMPPRCWTVIAKGVCEGDQPIFPAEVPAGLPDVKPSDTVAILYTSGTTGPSKGVCCPQAQLFWWGLYSARALGVREGDVLMTMLPVFHTNALNTFYQALLMKGEYVLEPRFTASGFWDIARARKANVTYLLGAMAAILMAQPEKASDRDHSLRVALGGGVPGPMHAPFLERFGVPMVDGYGSTETNFIFYSATPSAHPGTMGFLEHGAHAIVADRWDNPVPDGEPGELLLRPTEPHSFASGYYKMADKTVETWANYWFHTGDRVVRDPDGNYRFIDRTKDAIRRRGENVSSWEVEQAILSHPEVEACAAYPVPSELGEDEVAVAVKPKAGTSVDPLALIRHVEPLLAYFAVPRYLRFVADMPLTENGKIRKVVFREDGITADMWDLETTGYKVKR